MTAVNFNNSQAAMKMINDMKRMAEEAESMGAKMNTRFDSMPDEKSSMSFSGLLTNALNQVDQVQQSAHSAEKAYELGDKNMSLGQVMLESKKAALSFQALVRVRNKFVEAYKEIMNMQW